MDELCAACLCSGRNLTLIGDTDVYQLYSQILNEIPVSNMCQFTIRVCWECKAKLCRFDSFKRQVKSSYMELLYYIQQDSVLPSRHPPLGVHPQPPLSLLLVKEEAEECHSPDHNQLETFVNDFPEPEFKRELRSAKSKQKPKKKVKKLKENIKKRKVKYKKPESNPEPSDAEPTDCPEDYMTTDDVAESKEDCMKETAPLRDAEPSKNVNEVGVDVGVGVKGERPQCVECGKLFSSKKTFRYHWNVLHKGQNRYPCPRCGKVYQWKSNLGRHMRSHKAVDQDELYCATCDKRFASIATFKQHLKISRRHVSETDFTFMCNECGKKFVSKTGLRDHVDWEHLKKIKFRCQLCSKPFKCRPSLYIHMQNVHRDKEKKDNLCHVCGKSYQNSAKLKYHIVAMHTSATPYRCPQCGAAFGWYSSLYRHVREVHYKMKLQHKKSKKLKKDPPAPPLLPQHFPPLALPPAPLS